MKTKLLLAIVFFSAVTQAAVTPIGVSIFPPLQFPYKEVSITGVRVSALWGNHWRVYGADLGVIGNVTQQELTGFAVSGVFNASQGEANIFPFQVAGLANINAGRTRIYGVQLAGVLNYIESESSITGLQVALVNASTATDIYGVQVGIYNRARRVYGFQIGLINRADSVHGLQIGFMNFHRDGIFSVAPVINFGF